MNYWWVNQGTTWKFEVPGGYMWAPNTTPSYFHWDNMLDVKQGDVVLSYYDTQIKAVGIATGSAVACPQPTEFHNAGLFNWSEEGWLVDVSFTELNRPLRSMDHIDLLAPTRPPKHGPLRKDGAANLGYLYRVPPAMAEVLVVLLDNQVEAIIESAQGLKDDREVRKAQDDNAEKALDDRDIPQTQKRQFK